MVQKYQTGGLNIQIYVLAAVSVDVEVVVKMLSPSDTHQTVGFVSPAVETSTDLEHKDGKGSC